MFLKPDFPALAGISVALGGAAAALALPGAVKPALAMRLYRAFPRSVWPGRVFSAMAFAWTAAWAPSFIVEFAPSAAEKLFPALQFILVGMVLATCFALPDLLSCRAAGMLMVLVPTPLLSAAQWHPSPCRYFVIAAAYAMAVCGMFFIAKPWLMRDAIFFCTASPRRTRCVAAACLAVAALFVALGLVAFPVAPGTAALR